MSRQLLQSALSCRPAAVPSGVRLPGRLIPLRARATCAGRGGPSRTYDVAIVGGGVIGSSIALHLSALAGRELRVLVIERDATYKWASAPRSAGGIRQQFSLPVNVQLSMYGSKFLKEGLQRMCDGLDVDTDVQFRECGYLILAPPGQGEAVLRENVATQHACGATWISLLDAEALKARFPWLSTDGLALGALGERNEGYFDPWALLQAMRKGSMARGVEYLEQEVVGIDERRPCGNIATLALADGTRVSAGTVVNAAGAFSSQLVSMCGPTVAALPVAPKKRCMWLVHAGADLASDGVTPCPPGNTPLTIDPTGVYFRSDTSTRRFLCGVSPRHEDDVDCDLPDLERIDDELFQETIWPALAMRAPAFESLRVESSWAGLYEYNTVDQNGVVGWHPDIPNMLLATGFSGHGLQQSPGVGLACAEMLLHRKFRTLDLACLGFERILRNEPLLERGIY